MQPADEQLRDIHGFYALQLPAWLLWSFYLLISFVIIYFVYTKFIKKEIDNSLTLFELTTKELKSLDLNQTSKNFYLSYSELVKNFFQERLSLDVVDKTADELKPILVSNPKVPTEAALLLSKIFKKGDLAKFARQEVPIDSRAQDIEVTVKIIADLEEALILEEERRRESKLKEDQPV